ncbi:CMRF35-like molecule 8 isoform X2 [Melanotaenia boesemani]|uniref:CMRF35-like molecule 8 isoform X2 n=1 Tax=Melanotaenia boesemani TaxID=1250792 RepID=UPI001C045778|nr:CMRF35-like molecule 8 isoform X2 [Melanotaenia boesemani]
MMNHFTFDLIYNTVLTNSGAEPSEPTEIEKQQLNLNFAKMRTFSIFYSLLCATLTEAAEINVEGHEWGEISFQCTHRHAFNNDKYFCKSPCKSNEDILVAVSPGTSVESGRITLQDSGNGAFTVTIKHLQLSDSQIYFCGVDRWGRDTYTSVHLSVHKALSTTIEPVISSTLTYQKITNSTQLTAGAETSEPTNLSTAKNFTNEEEQNISLGTMLYAAVGAVATLAILLLAIHLRKMPKCQPHVCSTSKDPSSMNKNNQEKVDCNRTHKIHKHHQQELLKTCPYMKTFLSLKVLRDPGIHLQINKTTMIYPLESTLILYLLHYLKERFQDHQKTPQM